MIKIQNGLEHLDLRKVDSRKGCPYIGLQLILNVGTELVPVRFIRHFNWRNYGKETLQKA